MGKLVNTQLISRLLGSSPSAGPSQDDGHSDHCRPSSTPNNT